MTSELNHAAQGELPVLPERIPESELPRSGFVAWLGRALAIVLVVGGVVALIVTNSMDMLPTGWLIGLIAGSVLLTLAVGLGLWFTKAPPKWARFVTLSLVAIVGIAGEAVTIKAAMDLDQFFERTAPALPTKDYSVIALSEHDASLESLNRKAIGELVNDPNKEAIEERLQAEFKNTFANCSDPTQLATELIAGRFDAAVLDSNLYAAYEEGDPEFFESTQVIYTFDIETAMAVPEPAPTIEPGRAFVVFISGIDTAGPISRVSRSDVNILMAVNPTTGRILLVNTPRDYYVQLHGKTGTKDKLTHAGIYGVQMSIDTLQDLYEVPIDYYARVNFSSLVKMVDLVGGIDLYNAETFKSIHEGGMVFQEGDLHLNGRAALAFSRERYAFASGDRQRGKNQQLVIAALIAKASQRENLLRYNDLLEAISDALEMTVPQDQVTNLVKQTLQGGTSWQVESVSVDGKGASEPTYSMGSMRLYVMVPDQATVDAARAKLEETLAG
jgi:LCP family protein required for cell wall assembly